MKTFNLIAKIVAALIAVAGVVYVIATFGDKIVAWAKKMLAKLNCCCDSNECECDCECECESDCENCPCESDCDDCPCCIECEEDAEEEVAEEDAPAEEDAAEDADFEG